jgi:hypothetical protein
MSAARLTVIRLPSLPSDHSWNTNLIDCSHHEDGPKMDEQPRLVACGLKDATLCHNCLNWFFKTRQTPCTLLQKPEGEGAGDVTTCWKTGNALHKERQLAMQLYVLMRFCTARSTSTMSFQAWWSDRVQHDTEFDSCRLASINTKQRNEQAL